MSLMAFRTFLWDDEIIEMAERLIGRYRDGDFVVLADETRGPLHIKEFDFLSHTSDFSHLGLPNFPEGRSLWYNGDYALFALRLARPENDYYVMSEYDVAVNVDVGRLLSEVQAAGLDIVAHDVRPATPDWFWFQNAASNYSSPYKFYMPFIIISGRAIDLLLKARQEDARRFGASFEDWPICETFIPSVAMASGLKVGNLADFVATDLLRYRPWMSTLDNRVWEEGSIAHPVLPQGLLIEAFLQDGNANDYFDHSSELYRALSEVSFEAVHGPLLQRLFDGRNHRGVSQLRSLARQQNLISDDNLVSFSQDLALGRPALSSSYSEFSFAQDCEIDAAGANGRRLEYDYGFHTESENYPWWMVDLESECVIDAAAIVNRLHFSERFLRFVIESSRDNVVWQARYWKMDDVPVSSAESIPWTIQFGDPFVARYLRVKLLGAGPLHLRKVAIRGRRLSV